MMTIEERLSRRESAELLTKAGYPGVGFETLASLACRGGGPPYIIFGRNAYYLASDLLSWAAARVQHRGGQPRAPKKAA